MSTTLDGFEAWFAWEAAACESTGACADLRTLLAPFGIDWLFLVDGQGKILAAEPVAGEQDDRHALENAARAWDAVHARPIAVWHAIDATPGAAFRLPLPGPKVNLVGFAQTHKPDVDLATQVPLLVALGVSLRELSRMHVANRELTARTRQLEAELECLRESHNTATGEAIEEHENRLRERSQYAQNLEMEVERRSRDLVTARKAAESANLAKSQFLANMSHEIRTPMTAILGYTDILIDEHHHDDGIMHWLGVIKRNGNHLLEIINDILDLSKIESGQLIVERVDCSPLEMAREILSIMLSRAEQKQVPLVLETRGALPDKILIDPTRLRQILINLVGNAIKFTSRGSVTIRVHCDRDHQGEYQLQFAVKDSGIGISPEQMSRLFIPFSQADASTTRLYGGTGLGLAISRRLAEMLGGAVCVESQLGVGSTFTLTIPCGKLLGVGWVDPSASPFEVVRALAIEESDRSELTGCRILLAEDGPDNQRFIAHVLKSAGASVDVVSNGLEAVQIVADRRAQAEAFHVVLMDMQMPELDGYGAVRAIRAAGDRTPVIALTAHAMSGDRQKCLAAGCDDYDSKPIDRRRLVSKILTAWRSKRSTSTVEPTATPLAPIARG